MKKKFLSSNYLANIYGNNTIDWENYNIEDALNDVESTILNVRTQNYLHGIQLLGARQYPGIPDIGVPSVVIITYKEDSGEFQYKVGVDDLIVFYRGRVGGRKSRLSRRSRKSLRKHKRKNI